MGLEDLYWGGLESAADGVTLRRVSWVCEKGDEIVVKGRKSVCVLDIECAFAEQQGYMIRALGFTELFFDVPVFLIIKDSRDARS